MYRIELTAYNTLKLSESFVIFGMTTHLHYLAKLADFTSNQISFFFFNIRLVKYLVPFFDHFL